MMDKEMITIEKGYYEFLRELAKECIELRKTIAWYERKLNEIYQERLAKDE